MTEPSSGVTGEAEPQEDVRLHNQHRRAQAIARQYGFDPMDETFARCVGAILEGCKPAAAPTGTGEGLQRYTLETHEGDYNGGAMEADPDGEWVGYDDAKAYSAALRSQLDGLVALNNKLAKINVQVQANCETAERDLAPAREQITAQEVETAKVVSDAEFLSERLATAQARIATLIEKTALGKRAVEAIFDCEPEGWGAQAQHAVKILNEALAGSWSLPERCFLHAHGDPKRGPGGGEH